MAHRTSRVVIIGAGPAGYTAALYASRALLSPILFTGPAPGGQLTITTDVENYPGFIDPIQGPWLMEQMEAQAVRMGTEVVRDSVCDIDVSGPPFRLTTDGGDTYDAQSVIIATGAQARWLGLESETFFRGHGVSACATCDGFFFRGKNVVVVGGGNTAVEEALFLTHFAKDVLVVHRRDELRAEKILQNRAFQNPKIRFLWNHAVEEIQGSQDPKAVEAVVLKDVHTQITSTYPCDGIFIAIGHSPTTEIFKGKLALTKGGYLQTAGGSTRTSVPGIFAAGDVTDEVYRQAVTAAGMGCMAALDAERFLENQSHNTSIELQEKGVSKPRSHD